MLADGTWSEDEAAEGNSEGVLRGLSGAVCAGTGPGSKADNFEEEPNQHPGSRGLGGWFSSAIRDIWS
jgi:hypothetical protein